VENSIAAATVRGTVSMRELSPSHGQQPLVSARGKIEGRRV